MLHGHDLARGQSEGAHQALHEECNDENVLVAQASSPGPDPDICHLCASCGQQVQHYAAMAKTFPQRPSFLATAEQVTAETRMLQRTDPSKWAVTLCQWNMLIEACKQSIRYNHIKNKKPWARYVNVHDMTAHFVIPWSKGSGCGLALLLNPDGLPADLMISHAWAEDVEQCQEAVNLAVPRCSSSNMWFCTFAQYQPEDDYGPRVEEQLDLEPVTAVLDSGVRKMIAIHTTTGDIYARLWCLVELDEAFSKIEVVPAYSKKYLDCIQEEYVMFFRNGGTHEETAYAAYGVSPSQAKCSGNDKARLSKAISARGGFEGIDRAVRAFRYSQFSCLAAPPLQVALKDPDSDVRSRAALALGELGEHAAAAAPALETALQDADWTVRYRAADALGKLGEAAVVAAPGLIAALHDEYREVRSAAADSLIELRFGAEEVCRWKGALQDSNADARRSAADALGKLGENAALAGPALEAALQDPDSEVRSNAADALGKLGKYAAAAVPSLVKCAMQDPNWDVCYCASDTLGKLCDHAATAGPVLEVALQDPSWNIRYHAANVLGKLGEHAAATVPALESALQDPHANVRYQAAFALGNLGLHAVRAAPALEAALQDSEVDVRWHATNALGKLGEHAVLSTSALAEVVLQDSDADVRSHAHVVLGKLEEYAAPPPEAAMQDEDESTQHSDCQHQRLNSKRQSLFCPQLNTEQTAPRRQSFCYPHVHKMQASSRRQKQHVNLRRSFFLAPLQNEQRASSKRQTIGTPAWHTEPTSLSQSLHLHTEQSVSSKRQSICTPQLQMQQTSSSQRQSICGSTWHTEPTLSSRRQTLHCQQPASSHRQSISGAPLHTQQTWPLQRQSICAPPSETEQLWSSRRQSLCVPPLYMKQTSSSQSQSRCGSSLHTEPTLSSRRQTLCWPPLQSQQASSQGVDISSSAMPTLLTSEGPEAPDLNKSEVRLQE
eukprot:TRINITY_DN12559_c0_g1_i1.p1 TRINITY_DN12559_c0_g1~~TRINITY_DN12559_c0_g1_i1.p1  ORF type:complete len:952 (-),score=178.80 TRINITY_DN12559_c0_g1_i1:193-3048(-)